MDHLILDRRVKRLKLLGYQLGFQGMSTHGPQAHGQGRKEAAKENK